MSKFNDPENEARGRNGWFCPRDYSIRKVGRVVTIGVVSKRAVWPPPIYIKLTHADALKLVRDLTTVVWSRRPKRSIGV